MILIGEKLNSSIPSTHTIFEAKDESAIIALIQKQEAAGADYLDVNASVCNDEEAVLLWVIDLIKQHSKCAIMIDTPNPTIMALAAKRAAGRTFILNSTTIDERFEPVTTLAKEYGCALVALPVSLTCSTKTPEDRFANIDLLVKKLREAGIPDEHIYLDVLVETLATNTDSAQLAIRSIAHIAQNYPQIQTTCGLSNVSFGLPKRPLINSAFLAAAMFAGLSSAILDPSSPSMRAALAATKVLCGQDEYCMEYITYLREQEEIG